MCHTASSSTNRQLGFTLVEQVVALAVAAIVVAMAVPAMAGLLTRSATRVTEDALFSAARLARSSAITHNTHALLCPSADGTHCSDEPDWQQGWIVALDQDHDGEPETTLLTSGVHDPHVRVVGSAGRDHVRFRPDGSAPGTNLSLVICPHASEGGKPRVVVISNAGRIREAQASSAQQARCGNHMP
ncbi:MAG TPA: GspH/FimT family pseudopilin [Oleiagrimonas sp.]|nr:GspH/FimT family pseudopilin [Oleiagrimonas sp.]